jgi:hypothetical protein
MSTLAPLLTATACWSAHAAASPASTLSAARLQIPKVDHADFIPIELEREERCWHAAVVAGVGALRAVRSGHLVDVRSGIPFDQVALHDL